MSQEPAKKKSREKLETDTITVQNNAKNEDTYVERYNAFSKLHCGSIIDTIKIGDDREPKLEETKKRKENTNKRGPYTWYNIKKYIGSVSSFDDLEIIPKTLLDHPLPQPRIHINDAGVMYELVHPERFNISKATDDQGTPINCLGAALKHVFNIDYNVPTIESQNILCETFDRLSGCQLVELPLFNRNRMRVINKNKRARHNKSFKENPEHICIQTPPIDYWRIFEVNAGCLLLKCSNVPRGLVITF